MAQVLAMLAWSLLASNLASKNLVRPAVATWCSRFRPKFCSLAPGSLHAGPGNMATDFHTLHMRRHSLSKIAYAVGARQAMCRTRQEPDTRIRLSK
ncbi:hypothetical protein BKA66DRAFT_476287 [Pyrenochaeta sp. MPI-SDFR-AT-0127]|nr:hypothetical protein BKA66DRAFT_476287 [Pyrenochaeta sp. MPI-SDFR-AT-0127]